MLILLSPAKTMDLSSTVEVPKGTQPQFATEAAEIVMQMLPYSVDELEGILGVSSKLAVQNYRRYQDFHSKDASSLQALLAYTGTVFKHIAPKDFSAEDFMYAQQNLRIVSSVYGLVRPLDYIKAYRMEYSVKLPGLDKGLYEYWRPKLTLPLIREVKKNGGVLVNLASLDVQDAFDWETFENKIMLITPEFKEWRNGKFETVRTYAKMARGEMTRFILKNRIEHHEELKNFSWEGFTFRPELSNESRYIFTSF